MIQNYLIAFFICLVELAFSQNPVVIAHRGASAYAPENTLAAFEKAIAMKATVIETDVHQTKDSVLVLMHDETVDRTTNGKGRIKDMLYADFKKLIIRSPLSASTEHPPSLEGNPRNPT